MKKILLCAAVAAGFAGFVMTSHGQSAGTKAPAAAPAAALPVKIGLVDMARVFKEYHKFNDLRHELKLEMTKSMEEAQGIATQAKKIQEELELLKKDSPEFAKREGDLARLSAEFDTKRKLANASYVRSEADIFETAYRDSTEVVRIYAEHFKFTMVMRFNSDELDADNPQKLASSLNKLVVYHQAKDDITDPVIEYLNRQYGKPKYPREDLAAEEKGPAAAPVRSANAPAGTGRQ